MSKFREFLGKVVGGLIVASLFVGSASAMTILIDDRTEDAAPTITVDGAPAQANCFVTIEELCIFNFQVPDGITIGLVQFNVFKPGTDIVSARISLQGAGVGSSVSLTFFGDVNGGNVLVSFPGATNLEESGNVQTLVDITAANGNQLLVQIASEVPEPASLALLGLSLAGLAWSRRRSV